LAQELLEHSFCSKISGDTKVLKAWLGAILLSRPGGASLLCRHLLSHLPEGLFKLAKAIRTRRDEIIARPGLPHWYAETKTLYNRIVAFYFELYQAHPGLLDLDPQAALTQAEKLTHRTKNNPTPLWPLVEAIPADIPAMVRRAAINAARGAFQSFYANYQRWHKQKEKFVAKGKQFHHRPPVPPRAFNFNVPFYAGMFKERTETGLMVRLYSGTSWQWVKLRLAKRAEVMPAEWAAGSPIIVQRDGRFRLHTPLEKNFKKPAKAIEQVATNPHLRLCAVDLNLGEAQAVCTILEADGTEGATLFIRGGHSLHARRKRLLGQVAVKRSKTGILAESEQDNKCLWAKIRAIEDNEAHRVSRRIVDFAREHGATILVFEHLGKLKPVKGRYSKRSNQKRAHWLKGRIVKYARYKAWADGLLTCRVSPAFTSQDCSGCGHRPVARYAEGEAPLEYRPGGPLFLCANCLKRGNADKNASVNIGSRFLIRCFEHLSKKPLAKAEGVGFTHAGASSSQIQAGGLNGLALPLVSLAKMRLTGRGYAAGTGDSVYAGVPEEAAAL
jgi:putative transposase